MTGIAWFAWMGCVEELPVVDPETGCPEGAAEGPCGCDFADQDGDGTLDCVDGCVDDPAKVEPGECGCGFADTDTDGDLALDCVDACPDDPAKTQPGDCGCGVAENNADGDDVPGCFDNCPSTFNPDQLDGDTDGRGDVCDNCPTVPNADQADADGNGRGDLCWCDPLPRRCIDGRAGTYPCDRVDLLSYLSVGDLGGALTNDVWGWVDPLSGTEYALVGTNQGVAMVDLDNPYCPEVAAHLVGRIPNDDLWRDVEVLGNYAYVGTETTSHGLQVFDLTAVRAYAGVTLELPEDHWTDEVLDTHTLTTIPGHALLSIQGGNACSGGLQIFDITDPLDPTFQACYTEAAYIHDAHCVDYAGPDTEHVGKPICVTANASAVDLDVVDLTDPTNPTMLSNTPYPQGGYAHQGWFTEDFRYLLVNDEFDETTFGVPTRTIVFDMLDLDDPVYVGRFEHATDAVDHQLFVVGDYVYQANYRAGLRILDLAGVATADLVEVAYFDVIPADDDPSFQGSWTSYPFFTSGVVPVNSIYDGIFFVRPNLP